MLRCYCKLVHTLYLEHISREKGEEDDDERKHEADVLNPGENKASGSNTTWLWRKTCILVALVHLHKNDQQNDALEAEVFAKCVDEEVSHKECILHE